MCAGELNGGLATSIPRNWKTLEQFSNSSWCSITMNRMHSNSVSQTKAPEHPANRVMSAIPISIPYFFMTQTRCIANIEWNYLVARIKQIQVLSNDFVFTSLVGLSVPQLTLPQQGNRVDHIKILTEFTQMHTQFGLIANDSSNAKSRQLTWRQVRIWLERKEKCR